MKQLFATLYTSLGKYVVTVEVPPSDEPPDVITWAGRTFRRNADDIFLEASVWCAVGGFRFQEDLVGGYLDPRPKK